MFRILHTSDWHLGHNLHGYSRFEEHQHFLDWLLTTISGEKIDALLVSGDIFDSANPPAISQQQFYRFVAQARIRFPELEIVLTGGNHDSPSRLNAPTPILSGFNIHLTGHLLHENRQIAPDHLIQLKDSTGKPRCWVAAIPFLRNADLLPFSEESDLASAFADVYRQAALQIAEQNSESLPVIAMGHAYLVGGELSPLSERKIFGGNQHAIPASVFTQDYDYVALGHLHLAQAVREQPEVRYCGSPLPLSMSELNYPHQVRLVEISNEGQIQTNALPVPLMRALISVPNKPLPIAQVLSKLSSEAFAESLNEYQHQPYLQIQVLLDKPEPQLKEQIANLLKNLPVRLARIQVSYPDTVKQNVTKAHADLSEITPTSVFNQHYQTVYQSEPEPALSQAFEQLMQELNQNL